MENARLIIDSPANGAWNMSVDQALLETADKTGRITLRFYRWSRPTLSLGYFQSHLDRSNHASSQECDLVRRKTGGGAILHDNELTYSLCVPSLNRWSRRNSDLYEMVHQTIIDYLKSLGVRSYFYRDETDADRQNEFDGKEVIGTSDPVIDQRAFMCFHRRSAGDICIRGHKVVGSAQRRLKHSILQHGSILLGRSEFASNILGIEDLQDQAVDSEQVIADMSESLEISLQVGMNLEKLSPDESLTAEKICSKQFGNDDWNLGR